MRKLTIPICIAAMLLALPFAGALAQACSPYEDCIQVSYPGLWANGREAKAGDWDGIEIEYRARDSADAWKVLERLKYPATTTSQPVTGQPAEYRARVVTRTSEFGPYTGVVLSSKSTGATTTPPAAECVTQGVDGYQLNLGSRNKMTVSRIATVPLGIPCVSCDASQDVLGKQIIADRTKATTLPNPKKPGTNYTLPNQVLAHCK